MGRIAPCGALERAVKASLVVDDEVPVNDSKANASVLIPLPGGVGENVARSFGSVHGLEDRDIEVRRR